MREEKVALVGLILLIGLMIGGILISYGMVTLDQGVGAIFVLLSLSLLVVFAYIVWRLLDNTKRRRNQR